MLKVVITTIQAPTSSVVELAKRIRDTSATLIIIGDSIGPKSFEIAEHPNEKLRFLSLEAQLNLPYRLSKSLPTKHYSRKNIGYLEAIAQDATCIYETDDDNAPLKGWKSRDETVKSMLVAEVEQSKWVNVYSHFSDEKIWPRGLPLDQTKTKPIIESESSRLSPIQQGLVNGSPDVDAVWRLTDDRPFDFNPALSLTLAAGNWCPFNTQSTWWWPRAYPLLYVPSNCSFRMCDIWKSFIAQRCLWAMGLGVTFHSPEVIQDRNEHDYLKDFEAEIPGYLHNNQIRSLLDDLNLDSGEDAVGENLVRCYEKLISGEIFPKEELLLVRDWLDDLSTI
jgi:hypothetical protein